MQEPILIVKISWLQYILSSIIKALQYCNGTGTDKRQNKNKQTNKTSKTKANKQQQRQQQKHQ